MSSRELQILRDQNAALRTENERMKRFLARLRIKHGDTLVNEVIMEDARERREMSEDRRALDWEEYVKARPDKFARG